MEQHVAVVEQLLRRVENAARQVECMRRDAYMQVSEDMFLAMQAVEDRIRQYGEQEVQRILEDGKRRVASVMRSALHPYQRHAPAGGPVPEAGACAKDHARSCVGASDSAGPDVSDHASLGASADGADGEGGQGGAARHATEGAPAGPCASAGPRADPGAGPGAGPSAGPGAGPSAGPGAGPSAGPGAGLSAGPRDGPRAGPRAGPSGGAGIGSTGVSWRGRGSTGRRWVGGKTSGGADGGHRRKRGRRGRKASSRSALSRRLDIVLDTDVDLCGGGEVHRSDARERLGAIVQGNGVWSSCGRAAHGEVQGEEHSALPSPARPPPTPAHVPGAAAAQSAAVQEPAQRISLQDVVEVQDDVPEELVFAEAAESQATRVPAEQHTAAITTRLDPVSSPRMAFAPLLAEVPAQMQGQVQVPAQVQGQVQVPVQVQVQGQAQVPVQVQGQVQGQMHSPVQGKAEEQVEAQVEAQLETHVAAHVQAQVHAHVQEVQFQQPQEFPRDQPRSRRKTWNYYLALLRKYCTLHGHCSPPASGGRCEWEDLSRWVVRVRDHRRLDKVRDDATAPYLTDRQVSQLDAMKFDWKEHDVSMSWDGHFARLREFVRAHGHADVPVSYTHPGCDQTSPCLGRWLQYQKSAWVNEIARLNGHRPMTTYRIGFGRREKLRRVGVVIGVSVVRICTSP